MWSLVPLLCLSGALAADKVDGPFDQDGVFDKATLARLRQTTEPTGEDFSVFLASNYQTFGVRKETVDAINATAELLEYRRLLGGLTPLPFSLAKNGSVIYAYVGEGVPFKPSAADIVTNVKYHFFHKDDETDIRGLVMNSENKEAIEKVWDPKLPLKIIIHGFTNNIESPFIQTVKNAYLKTGKYNVIGVDWGELCYAPWYWPRATGFVPLVGAQVGKVIDKLVDEKRTELSLVHIIGHSLGAHLAGIAGKHVRKGNVARITGLDPAGPFFWHTGDAGRLSYTDAVLVDVVHTNTGLLGKKEKLGHVDFYVNGGAWQPDCSGLVEAAPCSHGRCYEMFVDTILTKKGYDSQLCDHLPDNARGCLKRDAVGADADDADADAIHGVMGDGVAYKKQGPYYVEWEGASAKRE